MKFSFLCCFAFLLTFSFSSFAQFERGIKEHKGFRYKIRETKNGKLITKSNILQIQMKVFTNSDSLLQQTYPEKDPILIDLREVEINKMAIAEILMKARIGDSLTIFTLSDSIFKGNNEPSRPDFIPIGSWIRQEFRLVKNYTPKEYEEYTQQMQQDVDDASTVEETEVVEIEGEEIEGEEEMVAVEAVETTAAVEVEEGEDVEIQEVEVAVEEEAQTTLQKDPNAYYVGENQEDYIENVYLKLNEITDYKKTKSGLFYTIEKQGTAVKKGDKLEVHYQGTFMMTGEQFDSSFDRDEPIEITIGEDLFIEGWAEGITLLGKGGKGTLYIPAKLAYGKQGISGQIPADAILIYKIEILE